MHVQVLIPEIIINKINYFLNDFWESITTERQLNTYLVVNVVFISNKFGRLADCYILLFYFIIEHLILTPCPIKSASDVIVHTLFHIIVVCHVAINYGSAINIENFLAF